MSHPTLQRARRLRKAPLVIWTTIGLIALWVAQSAGQQFDQSRRQPSARPPTTANPTGAPQYPNTLWGESRVAQLPPPGGASPQQPGGGILPPQVVPQLQEQPANPQPTTPWGPSGLGRLPTLSQLPPGFGTPAPSPETLNRYQQYLEGTIDPQVTLDLVVGRPRILRFRDPPLRVFIPDENVARFQTIDERDPREFAVTGNTVGSTVLNVWVADPQSPNGQAILSYLIRVIPDPERRERLDLVYGALAREINEAFPDSLVEITLVGDQIVVRGEAKDALEAAQIIRVVQQNAPPTRNSAQRGTVNYSVSQTSYAADGTSSLENLQGLSPEMLASGLLEGESNVINLLRIPGEQQVMLRVTVAEVNRSAARSIGLNFSIADSSGLNVFQNLTGPVGANLPTFLDNGQIALAINALRNLKLAKTLAEPNLTALNGQTAAFQAGGQFPIPVVTGFTAAGLQGVQFVPFGVQLQFTPFVVDRDRVRLRIAADVSTRDESLGTSVGGSSNGTSVSGLNTRNFRTTVELREGQTLAVAGLIQTNQGADSDRVPFFGDLPLIGRLAGFDRVSAGEQELVILITPEFVHPLDACQTPPLPGSDVFEPGDIEFFLQGRLESRRSQDFRSPVRTDYDRLKRYFDCNDLFIIGPHGHSYGCCTTGCGTEVPGYGVPQYPTPAAGFPPGQPIPAQYVTPPR